MNGKTARKILWRRRTENFWGARAYFTVRIDVKDLPEQCPKFDHSSLGERTSGGGAYVRTENGRTYFSQIDEVSSGKPRELGCYFVEKEDPGEEEDRAWYTFWEGRTHVFDAEDYSRWNADIVNQPRPTEIERFPLPEEVVAAYRARALWFDRYVNEAGFPEGHPLARLAEARNSAETVYGRMTDRFLYLTFSVRYYRHRRAGRFASTVARAIKDAKRAGLDVRAL